MHFFHCNAFKTKLKLNLHSILIFFVTVILSACGSDGNSSSSLPSSPSSPFNPIVYPSVAINYTVPSDVADIEKTLEYNRNANNFETIAVPGVWVQGNYAQNVTIAVIDDGVHLDNDEFQGKTITQYKELEVGSETYTYDQDHIYSGFSHGSAVAGILLANFDALAAEEASFLDRDILTFYGLNGVAFGANLVDVPLLHFECQIITCVIDSTDEEPQSLVYTNEHSALISKALEIAADASFVNMSFGLETTIKVFNDSDVDNATLTASLDAFIDPIKQAGKSNADKSVFVVAAGNAYEEWSSLDYNYAVDPLLLATLPSLDSELDGLVVAAVALDSDNNRTRLADYSNRCGIAADYCVAAPGSVYTYLVALDDDYETEEDGTLKAGSSSAYKSYTNIDGTSFAAPIITGSLGIIYGAFGGSISPMETLQRLLTTADNSTCSTEICGRGIINVTLATLPIGGLSLQYGESVYAQQNIGQQMVLKTPAGLVVDTQSVASENVVLFDDQNAPFSVPLTQVLSLSAQSHQPLSYAGANPIHSSPITLAGYAKNPWTLDRQLGQSGSHWRIHQNTGHGLGISFGFSEHTSALNQMGTPDTSQPIDSSLDAQTLVSQLNQVKMDVLSASVAKQFGATTHALSSSFCSQGLECSRFDYAVNTKSWALGWKVASVLDDSSNQAQWSGLVLAGALQSQQQVSKGNWSSLTAHYHLNPMWSMGWQRTWVNGEQSSSQAISQTALHSSNWNGVEDVFHLTSQWEGYDFQMSVLKQSDASGSIEISVPKARTIDGDLVYGISSVAWNNHIDQVIELKVGNKQSSCFSSKVCSFNASYQQLYSSQPLVGKARVGLQLDMAF